MKSTWRLDAPRQLVWQTVAAEPGQWSEWWPELRSVRDVHLTPGLTGSKFTCTWQSHVGYSLDSVIEVGRIKPEIEAELFVVGDLKGRVVCAISEADGLTVVKVDWQVETTKAWMNRLAPVLAPIFVLSHHAVMWRGERGLRRYLANKKAQ